MLLICLNMLVMMIQHYGQSQQVNLTMNILLFCLFFSIVVSDPQALRSQFCHALEYRQ